MTRFRDRNDGTFLPDCKLSSSTTLADITPSIHSSLVFINPSLPLLTIYYTFSRAQFKFTNYTHSEAPLWYIPSPYVAPPGLSLHILVKISATDLSHSTYASTPGDLLPGCFNTALDCRLLLGGATPQPLLQLFHGWGRNEDKDGTQARLPDLLGANNGQDLWSEGGLVHSRDGSAVYCDWALL